MCVVCSCVVSQRCGLLKQILALLVLLVLVQLEDPALLLLPLPPGKGRLRFRTRESSRGTRVLCVEGPQVSLNVRVLPSPAPAVVLLPVGVCCDVLDAVV